MVVDPTSPRLFRSKSLARPMIAPEGALSIGRCFSESVWPGELWPWGFYAEAAARSSPLNPLFDPTLSHAAHAGRFLGGPPSPQAAAVREAPGGKGAAAIGGGARAGNAHPRRRGCATPLVW